MKTNPLIGRTCCVQGLKVVGVCVSVSPSSIGQIAEIQLPDGKIVPYRAERLIVDATVPPVITGSGASSPAAAKLVAEAEKAASGGMNKMEQRYAQEVLEARRLSGEIRQWRAQAFRIRLADDTFYWPDFYVELTPPAGSPPGTPPQIEMHETKGYMREDARVKLSIAADTYRSIHFYKITTDGKTTGSDWTIVRIYPGPARSGEGSVK